jgi:hypothetical protein
MCVCVCMQVDEYDDEYWIRCAINLISVDTLNVSHYFFFLLLSSSTSLSLCLSLSALSSRSSFSLRLVESGKDFMPTRDVPTGLHLDPHVHQLVNSQTLPLTQFVMGSGGRQPIGGAKLKVAAQFTAAAPAPARAAPPQASQLQPSAMGQRATSLPGNYAPIHVSSYPHQRAGPLRYDMT